MASRTVQIDDGTSRAPSREMGATLRQTEGALSAMRSSSRRQRATRRGQTSMFTKAIVIR
jgi:hypothetical protein